MKIGQYFIQLRRVKFRQKIRKISERHRALIKILRIAHDLIRNRILYVCVHPEICVPVLKITFPLFRPDNVQTLPRRVTALFLHTFPAKRCNQLYVVHQLLYIRKQPRIDLLQNIMHLLFTLLHGQFVGDIDMPFPVPLTRYIFTFRRKISDNLS